jgi:uncharacterized membrane protein
MSDSRARVWFALFVLAVFCVGGAGGFILGRHLPPFPDSRAMPPGAVFGGDARWPPPGDRGPIEGGPPFGRPRSGPGGPAGLPPPVAARLADDLQLDPAQRAQFRKVLEDHRIQFEQVHREARDRFDAEQRELQAAIRALLRSDQVQRFDAFINGRRP